MPKDTTSEFFIDQNRPQGMNNPDNASKWIGVAEKGISLIENLINMKKAKEGKNGGESSAYEKGLSQGMQQAPLQAPIIIPPKININYKSQEAANYLKDSLSKLDQKKTIGDYLNGEIKEMEEAGILKAGIEHFLKSFVEVNQ